MNLTDGAVMANNDVSDGELGIAVRSCPDSAGHVTDTSDERPEGGATVTERL